MLFFLLYNESEVTDMPQHILSVVLFGYGLLSLLNTELDVVRNRRRVSLDWGALAGTYACDATFLFAAAVARYLSF